MLPIMTNPRPHPHPHPPRHPQRNKQRLQVEGNDKKTERESMLAEVRQLRDNSKGPLDPAALEARINELEFKLTHESLAPAEEKRVREQKERMIKVDRPNGVKYAALQVSQGLSHCTGGDQRFWWLVWVLGSE